MLPFDRSHTLTNLWQQKQKYLKRNLYSKHIYWNIKRNSEQNNLPLFFRPVTHNLPYWPDRELDGEQCGLYRLGSEAGHAALFTGELSSSCPAELCTGDKAELPF